MTETTTKNMPERFFIPRPVADGTVRIEGQTFRRYRNERGEELLWSALFPVPAVGDAIVIEMNSIGKAIVMGYFEAHGFLGVMTRSLNPPEYLRKQQVTSPGTLGWQRAGIGCEYGAEISLDVKDWTAKAKAAGIKHGARLVKEAAKRPSWLRNAELDRDVRRSWATPVTDEPVVVDAAVEEAWAAVELDRMEDAIDREIARAKA